MVQEVHLTSHTDLITFLGASEASGIRSTLSLQYVGGGAFSADLLGLPLLMELLLLCTVPVEAPEWRLHGEYTRASDWYALGQLLYHVCCPPSSTAASIPAKAPEPDTAEPVWTKP
jgi:hypothetical protein